MKAAPKLLALAVLAALSTPALAETEFDVIGGSEISFEGLLQTARQCRALTRKQGFHFPGSRQAANKALP